MLTGSLAVGFSGYGIDDLVLSSSTTDVDMQDNITPTQISLFQNHPNPFNPTTTIRYDLPREERVTLKIYDILGKEVATLLNNEIKASGNHAAIWDGRNNRSQMVASGIYFYRLQAGSFSLIKKMAYVR